MPALAFTLLSSITALTAQATSQEPAPQPTIVVTGPSIAGYRAALAACLARHCRPDEDIDATTALAEALFVDGQYRDARRVLRDSIGRNRRQAVHYPEPVSDLFRANARVARHLGFDDDAQRSTWEILHSLQAGIAVEDYRHFTARLEIIDSLVAFGQYAQAEHELRNLLERARTAGRDDVAATAELRSCWIAYLQASSSDLPVRQLIELAASPDPRRSVGAKMLLVRIFNERGEHSRADQLIAQLSTSGPRRQLLFAPPYELIQREDVAASAGRAASLQAAMSRPPPRGANSTSSLMVSNLADRLTDNFEDQMIDVSFRIRPDGSVADVQIVNRRGSGGWEPPLIQSIAGRRYSPARDGSEAFRIERYTYTSERRVRDLTGTHIGNRSPRGRVEFQELSETNLPATQS